MSRIKRNKTLFQELNVIREPNDSLTLLRIVSNSEFTKLDFGYTPDSIYHRGGWIRISSDTYIEVIGSKGKLRLIKAEGIPVAPEQHHFESKRDWQYFSLYFPPIEQTNCKINLIEDEKPDHTDFNLYDIDIKIDTADEIIIQT
ncbi:MAG: hypothetical protein QNK78_02420 [Crocinitomicaceae bacterium]